VENRFFAAAIGGTAAPGRKGSDGGTTDRHWAGRNNHERTTPMVDIPTPGGVHEDRVLDEPGVMRLIVSAKLPAAREFERFRRRAARSQRASLFRPILFRALFSGRRDAVRVRGQERAP
jgi:hypothetical protein